MLFKEAGSCIVGEKLFGISKDNRPNIKTSIIILKEHNNYCLVLKNNCSCEILQEINGLSDEEYKICMKKLREIGCGPISDSIEYRLEGRRILCEFNGEPQLPRSKKRKEVVMKSKIAVAHISGKEVKSKIYVKTDKFVLKR